MNKKSLMVVMAVMLVATPLHARRIRNFQFSEFGYRWTTDSGSAPGPGTFSPSHVSPLSSGIGFTLTETDTGSIVGGEARTLDRFLYGTFQWTEYVPIQASGQVSAGFLYYSNSITEIDVEQTGDHPGTFWFTSWVGTASHMTTLSCCYDASVPHAITLVWKPGEVDYFVDGVLLSVHTQNVPSTAAYFIFNFWGTNSTDWGGLASAGTRYYVVSDFSYSPSY
jgi:Glycosyl hydrolases family 16